MTLQERTITDSTRRASETLLEALRRWRAADRSASAGPLVPGLRLIDANRVVVEQAKGALMLRYGIDSHQAFALLARWSRATKTPVPTLADTLLHGICEGNPETERRQRSLVRWLEDQLRNGDPDPGIPAQRTGRLRAGA
jgi:hypothetical protein